MAKESQGVIVYWSTVTVANGAAAGATANAIGEVMSFNGPNLTAAAIDITNLQSTAKEKMVGVYDAGQVTLNVAMTVTNDTQKKLRKVLAARTLGSGLIQLSTASTTQKIFFDGYISGLSFTGAVDNVVKGDVVITLANGVSIST